ncbi:hypothetical protein [Paenibacillus sp. 7523-1]|uniref:hypothetical protein n=1 Tax=Paenibacillus sp. 7523-1 TaxID=2022550 RepID=UPI000BA56F9F|nr:hypothetical protein [Paenibacillus sp. 7523-1]PAD29562.1 hypothetical protein CHH60_20390 [Paenibacillus sp. 7523-1]
MKMIYSLVGSVTFAFSIILASFNVLGLEAIFEATGSWQDDPLSELVYIIYGVIAFPIVSLSLFPIFIWKYHKLNIRGIAIFGGIGIWLFFGIYIYSIHMAKYVMWIPLVFMVVGYYLTKLKYDEYKLRNLLLGMILGWVVSYLIVIGKRLFQNSLTSYFNFNLAEQKFVIIAIAFFGITGWLFGKYNKHS